MKEWCYKNFKENHDHRHFSHLYPLWPGDEITEENPFYDACATAIEKRTANGLQHQSGWSLTHLSSLYCRLKDGAHCDYGRIGDTLVGLTCGDTDLSGYISVTDATLVQKYVVGIEDFDKLQLFNSDVNHDGEISVVDATLIQKYIVGLDS